MSLLVICCLSGVKFNNIDILGLQRSKPEDYNDGRNLLERCDKLLHSIAEITANELQPSPVSVLDSSFYKEESSPSPVMKRTVDFEGKSFSLSLSHSLI